MAPASPPNLSSNGLWKLDAGRAVTLRPKGAGVLRIARGRVWATVDGPHERQAGDLFLDAGSHLAVQAGQRLVIEPLGAAGSPATVFDWTPAPAIPAWRWPAVLVQPASDLGLAMANAGLALRGATGALLRLMGALLSLVPMGMKNAIDWIANSQEHELSSSEFHSNSCSNCAN